VPAARIAFYVATIAAFALVLRSVLLGPLPLWVSAGAMAAYVGLILWGVFSLRLRMYVDAVLTGPEDGRGVALTFDDGPHPVHTRAVLAALREAGVQATFFVVGRKVKLFPDVVREIVEGGHALGIHSHAHDRLMSLMSPAKAEADLLSALDAVEEAVGERPYMFRPPVGHTSPRLAKAVEKLGLAVVGWSARGYDGLGGADPDKVARRVVAGLADSAIVLLHDAAERDDHDPAAVAALPAILAAMKGRALPAVRVDAWVERPEASIARSSLAS
jgi:peptidoglycan/xylan/chitin deacetylase (PgdA/CDA1 family)